MKDSEQKKAKNLYNCHQCGNTIVTEDIGCSDGRMWSFGYNVPPSEVKELSNGRKITVPTKQGTSGRTSLHKKFNPKKNKK